MATDGIKECIGGRRCRPVLIDRRLPGGDAVGPDQRLEARAGATQLVGDGGELLVDRGQQRRELDVVPTQQVGKMLEPGGLALAAEHDPERSAGGKPVQQPFPRMDWMGSGGG